MCLPCGPKPHKMAFSTLSLPSVDTESVGPVSAHTCLGLLSPYTFIGWDSGVLWTRMGSMLSCVWVIWYSH